jgi:hypothetical protein
MPIAGASLKYYLSGGAGNADPNAALGGVRSTTLVGAGLNNLFDDVTGDEAAAGVVEYLCIFFRNEDANANGLIGPVAWIDVQSEALDTVSIGIDPAGKNAAAAVIANEAAAPAGVAFTTPITKGTGLALPGAPYAQNDFVAIWVRRTVGAGAASINPDTASVRVEGDSF